MSLGRPAEWYTRKGMEAIAASGIPLCYVVGQGGTMPDRFLLRRFRERKLVQWALAYLAGAFVVFQAVEG